MFEWKTAKANQSSFQLAGSLATKNLELENNTVTIPVVQFSDFWAIIGNPTGWFSPVQYSTSLHWPILEVYTPKSRSSPKFYHSLLRIASMLSAASQLVSNFSLKVCGLFELWNLLSKSGAFCVAMGVASLILHHFTSTVSYWFLVFATKLFFKVKVLLRRETNHFKKPRTAHW